MIPSTSLVIQTHDGQYHSIGTFKSSPQTHYPPFCGLLQIIVMNMLLGATTFSSLAATYMAWPFFFTKTYQLIPETLANE